MTKSNRYQHQKWYIKLWRRRFYLTIPFVAIRIWFSERRRPLRDKNDWHLTFSQSWSLAIGLAQGPMKWYYTFDEVKERQAKRDEDSYKITWYKSAGLIWVKVDSHPEWVGCGKSKEQAIKTLRNTIEFSRGLFNLKDIFLAKKARFSRTGKL